MNCSPHRSDARIAASLTCLVLAIGTACSERPAPKAGADARGSDVRKIRFANEWVVISFRSGLRTEPVPQLVPGFIPKAGDRVVLSDVGDGEVFLAGDLDSLKFYHSSPGSDQLGRFRLLAGEGRLFVVARGTAGSVSRVAEGELPDGLRAIELQLPGEKGGAAWVSDPFIRRLGDDEK